MTIGLHTHTTNELIIIRNDINLELLNRQKNEIKSVKDNFDIDDFISFVELELELNLKTKCRKRPTVYYRYCLFDYLYNDLIVSVMDKIVRVNKSKIARAFKLDHSSVIAGLQQFKNLKEDVLFIDYYIEIQEIIQKYNERKMITERSDIRNFEIVAYPTVTDKNGKEFETLKLNGLKEK